MSGHFSVGQNIHICLDMAVYARICQYLLVYMYARIQSRTFYEPL